MRGLLIGSLLHPRALHFVRQLLRLRGRRLPPAARPLVSCFSSTSTGSTSIAKGHTQIKVRNDGTIGFKTKILNRGNETFVAGHIHQAPAGTAGAVVVPLFVSPTPPTNARPIKQSGVATPNAGTTGAAICQNPNVYYVNYHTTAFAGGAIRGQLR